MAADSEKGLEIFKAQAEHEPKSETDKYERLHYYVYHSSLKIIDLLRRSLADIRKSAPDQAPELQRLALKPCKSPEMTLALKEVLCVWFHLEALDQGGEGAPGWVLRFLRLSIACSDHEIPNPLGLDILHSYETCPDEAALSEIASVRTCKALGFGPAAETFAPAVRSIFVSTDAVRRDIFEEAMTLPLDRLKLSA